MVRGIMIDKAIANARDEREVMMDRMCRRLGMEYPTTVMFCMMCEMFPKNEYYNKILRDFYKTEMAR